MISGTVPLAAMEDNNNHHTEAAKAAAIARTTVMGVRAGLRKVHMS